MPTIAIFFANGNRRSRLIADAMYEGARRLGIRADRLPSTVYRGRPEHDVAIFYGLADGLRRVFEDYSAQKRAVYIDLGYWGRRKLSRYDGYHKFAVNSRHPTAYFQLRPHSSQRFDAFRIPVRPWRKQGSHILVAGMSAKAALAEGFGPEGYERDIIARLRKITDRPIIYRPKPNWAGARLIPGAAMQPGDVPLERALANCHAVVTHHSNVAIDGLLAGVPCITTKGVASVFGSTLLEDIERLPMLEGRAQWAADIAWTQWSVDEMKAGAALRYLLDEGLIS